MRPTTKFEKRVVALSKKLKPITPAQKKWGFENCFKKVALVTKNKANCMECGLSWNHKDSKFLIDIILPATCPGCGCKLKKVQSKDRTRAGVSYYAILTTVEEMQVVRTFYLKKTGRSVSPVN